MEDSTQLESLVLGTLNGFLEVFRTFKLTGEEEEDTCLKRDLERRFGTIKQVMVKPYSYLSEKEKVIADKLYAECEKLYGEKIKLFL